MEYTKEIETPVAGHKVVVKTMITGAEREQIETASQSFVKTKDGKSIEVTDMAKMTLAAKHQLLKVSVMSIDGDTANCFERLQKMYEPDYEYVYKQIEELQKKMMPSTSPAS